MSRRSRRRNRNREPQGRPPVPRPNHVPPPPPEPLSESLEALDPLSYGLDPFPPHPTEVGPIYAPWAGREGGDSAPAFRDEPSQRLLLLLARHLTLTSPQVTGAFDKLLAYCIGGGFKYTASSKKKRAPQDLVDTAQDFLDQFLDANSFVLREAEAFTRSRRDGEAFLRLFPQEDGSTLLRFLEPELVREPASSAGVKERIKQLPLQEAYFDPDDEYSTTFGVITPNDDPETPLFYHVLPGPNAPDGELVPGTEVVHFKSNVDLNTKRGLSDLFALQATIPTINKFLRNMGQGSALQMAIAWIRESAAGTTPGALQGLVAQGVDVTRNVPLPGGGTREDRIERFDPGTIVNTTQNTKYLPPPLAGTAAAAYTDIGQFLLRSLAVRWSMPEGMFSSSSDSSYASALAAESPFAKTIEVAQARYKNFFLTVIWKALRHWADTVRPSGLSVGQFTHLIEVQAEPPSLVRRNRKEETDIRGVLFDKGILSARTWAIQEGLDYEQERENIRREAAEGAPKPANGQPPDRDDRFRIPIDQVSASLRQDLGLDRDPYRNGH